jgi:Gpi18-like mannosyltransferase
MWSAACVMALAAALQRRHAAMLAWCGIALGFKLQAAFFFPFVLGLLIARRVPLRLWPIGPAVWFATLLPAWAAGWPLGDLLTIYLRQGGAYAGTVLNAPNIWSIADALPALDGVPLTGLAFAAASGASATYVAWLSSRPQYGRQLMEAALLAPLLVVGLLPRMHERYFFLADVLSLVIALAWPDRRSVTIAALVQAGSLLALLAYMSGVSGLAGLGAVAMIVATIRLARPLLVPAANDNPVLPPLRPSTA